MSTSAIAVRGTASQSDVQDYDAIVEVMNRYNEGVRTGSSAMMKPAFHEAATLFGYIEGKLLAGSIQMLFDWVDKNGPSHDLQSRIVSVAVHQTIAVVRVELENLKGKLAGDSGARLSDLFQFIKIDGTWKMSQKSFHWY
jgi:putative lumazine-binding protein